MTDNRPDRVLTNVPDGMQPVVLARQVEARLAADPEARVAAVFVARDGRRLQRMADVLEQLMPGHPVLTLPAWDCLPYDRVSPNGVTVLGPYADAHADTLGEAELLRLETFMAEEDTDLLKWVMGQEVPPATVDTALLAEIIAFRIAK